MRYKRKHIVMLLCTSVLLASGCARIQNRKAQIPVAAQQQQVEMRFGIARLLERNGKLEEARKAYSDILAEYPNHDQSYHRIAVSLVRQERIAEALVYFEKAANAKTPGSEMLGDWGYAQYLAGDTETAEVTLRQAIQKSPNDQRSINNLAIVLGEQNRLGEALELFRRVNNEAEAMANLAFVQTQLGEFTDAKTSYHRALDLKPSLEIAANGLLELHENGPGEKGARAQVSSQPTNDTLPNPREKSDEAEIVVTTTDKPKSLSAELLAESLPSKPGLEIVEIDTVQKGKKPQKPKIIEFGNATPKKADLADKHKDSKPKQVKSMTIKSKDLGVNEISPTTSLNEEAVDSTEARDPLSVFADEFKIFN